MTKCVTDSCRKYWGHYQNSIKILNLFLHCTYKAQAATSQGPHVEWNLKCLVYRVICIPLCHMWMHTLIISWQTLKYCLVKQATSSLIFFRLSKFTMHCLLLRSIKKRFLCHLFLVLQLKVTLVCNIPLEEGGDKLLSG